MCDNDEYETSDPLTIGGATGQYAVPSPYHTECEWAIISATGIGTLGSAATFAIGSKNPKQPTLSSTGADSFGSIATSGPDSNNALPSYVGAVTSQASFITFGGDNYMPLPSPAFVYLTITTPATTELLVTVQFRRKLERIIPDKPRSKPHTHTHVQGRGQARRMSAGFDERYGEEGVPYEHQQLQPQDTGMARRGVFPLGPTDTTHRKVGRNGR